MVYPIKELKFEISNIGGIVDEMSKTPVEDMNDFQLGKFIAYKTCFSRMMRVANLFNKREQDGI